VNRLTKFLLGAICFASALWSAGALAQVCTLTSSQSTAVVGQVVTVNLSGNCNVGLAYTELSISAVSPSGAPHSQPIVWADSSSVTFSGAYRAAGTYCYTFDAQAGTGSILAQSCPGETVLHSAVALITVTTVTTGDASLLQHARQLIDPQMLVAELSSRTQLKNIRERLDERRRMRQPGVEERFSARLNGSDLMHPEAIARQEAERALQGRVATAGGDGAMWRGEGPGFGASGGLMPAAYNTQGGATGSGRGWMMAQAGESRWNDVLAAGEGSANEEMAAAPSRGGSGDAFDRFGWYVYGSTDHGKQGAITLQPGFDTKTRDMTLGADYRLNGNHVMGAALGLLRANASLAEDSGRQDARGYSLSVYGTYVPAVDAYLDLIASLGRNTYDSSRYGYASSLGAITDYASSTRGRQFALSASLGYNHSLAALTLNPYARAEYLHATVDGFAEQGSQTNDGAVAVSGQRLTNTQLTVGGQVSYVVSTSWGLWIPLARLEFQRQSATSRQDVTAQEVLVPTTSTAVPLADIDKIYGNAELGFSVMLPHGVGGFLAYQRLFGKSNFQNTHLTLGLRGEF
jgi:uncharacterized protein YhjY with autotransporter beta-barrel domain